MPCTNGVVDAADVHPNNTTLPPTMFNATYSEQQCEGEVEGSVGIGSDLQVSPTGNVKTDSGKPNS